MPNQPKTPTISVRLFDAETMAALERDAAQLGLDRSGLLRQLAAWWMRKPGAKLPPRPPRA